jgi:hypothetical protein
MQMSEVHLLLKRLNTLRPKINELIDNESKHQFTFNRLRLNILYNIRREIDIFYDRLTEIEKNIRRRRFQNTNQFQSPMFIVSTSTKSCITVNDVDLFDSNDYNDFNDVVNLLASQIQSTVL